MVWFVLMRLTNHSLVSLWSELNMNNPIKTSYVEKQFIVQECLKPDEKQFRQNTTPKMI